MGVRKMLLLVLVVILLAVPAAADDALRKQGGQLYDKWYAGKKKPDVTHPLYPAFGKKKGAATWRCKECHGWDYIGAQGRYADGSHYTGIDGTLHVAGRSVSEIEQMLKRDQHDFTRFLSPREIRALATFLSDGQVNVDKYIDTKNQAVGNDGLGQPLYSAQCAPCHGVKGGAIDFKSKVDGVQGVGWLARKNPQETLHKIRYGHPGTDMPSMVVDAGLSEKQIADLLAYTQKLEQ